MRDTENLFVPGTGFRMCQTWLNLERSQRKQEKQSVLMHETA